MRDIANKIDNTSTLSADEFNGSIMQELENAVTNTGITLDPSGGADTDDEMLAQAITRTAQGGLSYQDSGAADAYVLSAIGGYVQPAAYTDGMMVMFEAGNTNTGASTLNVSTIGSTDLKDSAGVALTAGAITAGVNYIARYDLAGTEFRIVFSGSAATEFASDAETQAGTSTTKAVTPAGLDATMLGGAGTAWTDVIGSRAYNTNYTNTTGRPIYIYVQLGSTTSAQDIRLFVDGIQVAYQVNFTGGSIPAAAHTVVPNGSTYSVTRANGSTAVQAWKELR